MLNRRGFLKGVFGAVALIAAAPALRVADAVVPGPPPPTPSPKRDRRTMIFTRYDSVLAVQAASHGPLPVGTVTNVPTPIPEGMIVCDGRAVPLGAYPDLEDALRCMGYPYGETPTGFRVPDFRGRA